MSKFYALHLTCCLALSGFALGFSGCLSSTNAVSGTVTADGQPVTSGTITLAPVAAGGSSEAAGGPVSGAIGPDGKFKVAEGTVVGKHRVMFSPPAVEQPEWDGYGTPPAKVPVPYEGMVAKESEVDIKAGTNELTIELVKGTGK